MKAGLGTLELLMQSVAARETVAPEGVGRVSPRVGDGAAIPFPARRVRTRAAQGNPRFTSR